MIESFIELAKNAGWNIEMADEAVEYIGLVDQIILT